MCGRKQVENVQDHSKTSISVMWCGSASGECLLLMVVYKTGNLYKPWIKDGLNGCIYNVTKSGWFDCACFQQWFVKIFMKTVAEICALRNMCFWEQDNIYFAMLLSVAMHLLQSLDVCVFSLVKELWRKIQQECEREVKTKGCFNSFSCLF